MESLNNDGLQHPVRAGQAIDAFNGVESLQASIRQMNVEIIDQSGQEEFARLIKPRSWRTLNDNMQLLLHQAEEVARTAPAAATSFLAEAAVLILAQMRQTMADTEAMKNAGGG